MSSPSPRVPIERIREAAAFAIEATSLRKAAKEIGLSPSGLKDFVEHERQPYKSTRKKLYEWYLKHGRHYGATHPDVAGAAIEILAQDAPEARRPKIETAFIDAAEAIYGAEKLPPPAWIAALRSSSEG